MPLTLCPVSRSEFDLVSHIQVQPDQVRFSGTVAQAFEEDEDGVDFHAVLNDACAVGFFKIDRLYHETYEFARSAELGLRAFMIDREHQGKGFATAATAALQTYLTRHYPDRSAVVLTVNMQNPGAIRCYSKGGFEDTGGIYPHGMAGPQHILRMALAGR
ncbi:GNAT family N-acetyltransferase [Leisingera daeponensis]|uniref:GNAT family N-acetyltransferase n=1 Tax=Leisingera daeponensis TaxID=405746 RepID=UPI001C94D3CA|nr:GNAT family N-acetyltransferase [Leisingera daeponensis]MBY6057830.1 GNAT family N-acetyltransferase [Leisingera daeponensis]